MFSMFLHAIDIFSSTDQIQSFCFKFARKIYGSIH